jgi:hypothetical protein
MHPAAYTGSWVTAGVLAVLMYGLYRASGGTTYHERLDWIRT